ncbi:putative glycosyl transferase [Pirellulimonas nuda]|uniref:Putative glycosyl transferase n=1 Tax=Pirellulimonas nuda TaxID=2528009 RepID=A0A518DJ42_9BACT|nr:glycosyltransferase family 4 protein [Pirellulimonas nuda]QDU91499.1 putative glycosyl transferase [Pirellulimonas nuda]
MPKPSRILVISQVYVPDPASVGQHMADAAETLVKRGNRVRVLTSRRGYDDPSQRYAARENRRGVEVVRLPLSSLGKRSILVRIVAQLSFLLQATLRGLFTPGLGGIVVSTSPPMASIAAIIIRFFRRAPITFWVMDLNPDQVVATGRMKPTALAVRAMDWLNRRILGAARVVVPLDRFMQDRLCAKRAGVAQKCRVIPPWPMDGELQDVPPRSENPFVAQHGLQHKRVIMYSGNHGLTTPVDALVEAALALGADDRLHFMFIGGGPGKRPVDAAIESHKPSNLVSLPYQPLDQIRYSLPAADVHVVLMAEELVGVVHPCKIYGAMSVGKPILFIGPAPSHISEILELAPIGWRIPYGDVEQTMRVLNKISSMPSEELEGMGARAKRLVTEHFSQQRLCGAFCDAVEGS